MRRHGPCKAVLWGRLRMEIRGLWPGYTSFHDGRLAGGFTTDARVSADGVLVVFYAADLAATEAKVRSAGGRIVRETFSFPGAAASTSPTGGNVLAVWSE